MERITRKDYMEHRARVTQAKFKVDCRPPTVPSASASTTRTRRMPERDNTTLTSSTFRRAGSSLSTTQRHRPCKLTTIASTPHKMQPPIFVGRVQVETDKFPDMLKLLQRPSTETVTKIETSGDGEEMSHSEKPLDAESIKKGEEDQESGGQEIVKDNEQSTEEALENFKENLMRETPSEQLLQIEKRIDDTIRDNYRPKQSDKYNEKDTVTNTSTSSATTVESQPNRTKSLKELNLDLHQRIKKRREPACVAQAQALAKCKTAPSPLFQKPSTASNPSIPFDTYQFVLNPKAERESVKILKPKDSREVMVTISYAVSSAVLRHYEHMTFFMPKPVLLKILRPRFFMDLESHSRKYSRTLGRICFQLFTEASPGVILEIARCCNLPKGHEQMSITRIYDPMWVEGDICVDKNKGIRSNIQLFNEHVLSHRIGAGILSCSLQTKRSLITEREIINFAISLSSLEVPPGRRVALGIIAEGIDVLRNIKKFATKSGKPTDKIHITNCGIVME